MRSFSPLRRGLIVCSFFAARWASAADAPSTPAYTLELAEFDGSLPAGRAQHFTPSLVHSAQTAPVRDCIDDSAGCTRGCLEYRDRAGTGGPANVKTAAEVVEATCDSGCDVAVSPGPGHPITITGKAAGTTAHLHLTVKDGAGASVTADYAIPVTDDALRIARVGVAPLPNDVLATGEYFAWCAVGPTTETPIAASATATGPIVKEPGLTYPSCTAFRTTDAGRGTVTFTTADGRTISVPVDVVDESAAVDVDIVDLKATAGTGPGTDDVLASAVPLASRKMDSSGHDCTYSYDLVGRFKTADGRYGIVPISRGPSTSPNEAKPVTVHFGAVSKTIPVEQVLDCDTGTTADAGGQ